MVQLESRSPQQTPAARMASLVLTCDRPLKACRA
jgi:hypothetical protein